MANASILAAFERMWQQINVALSKKSDSNHNHDSKYDINGAASAALDSAKSYVDEKLSNLSSVGKSTTGKEYYVDGETQAAQPGAEIFNDYEENIAYGLCSHAEGMITAAYGDCAHTEGYDTVARGVWAHAEGSSTGANGNGAHAEGSGSYAEGDWSHAEGEGTISAGDASHAENLRTTASGEAAHAEGIDTVASGEAQHVQGRCNIEDSDAEGNPLNTYAHIIGNGDINNRSNAHTVDWDGNAWYAGDVYVGGESQGVESKKLATEEFVNSMIGGAGGGSAPRFTTIMLSEANWVSDSGLWSQSITVNGATANSKIDLCPTAIQFNDLQNSSTALTVQNDNGAITAWAIGGKPVQDYTIQAMITEVVAV